MGTAKERLHVPPNGGDLSQRRTNIATGGIIGFGFQVFPLIPREAGNLGIEMRTSDLSLVATDSENLNIRWGTCQFADASPKAKSESQTDGR